MIRTATLRALWTFNSTPPDLPLQRGGKGLETSAYLQAPSLHETFLFVKSDE